MPAIRLSLTAALAATSMLYVAGQSAMGAEVDFEPQFPYVIEHELGASGFSVGDQITITSVRGDRKHIEQGGSFLVEGTYTLASTESAHLALYCTTRGPSGPTPDQDSQHINVTRGAGRFHLYETNVADGWLHVSFYPKNSELHGGVYFGEKGNENTVMRDQEWFREFDVKAPNKRRHLEADVANQANRDLMAYLGNPVPPPAEMDQRYNKQNLLWAFTTLCRNADLVITKLAVDDSEFPFLVYGTLDGNRILPEAPAFEKQRGYTYGGSVRGSFGEGSTYFAVNMVPSSQYPTEKQKACHRRLMLRLQMLADKAQQNR